MNNMEIAKQLTLIEFNNYQKIEVKIISNLFSFYRQRNFYNLGKLKPNQGIIFSQN